MESVQECLLRFGQICKSMLYAFYVSCRVIFLKLFRNCRQEKWFLTKSWGNCLETDPSMFSTLSWQECHLLWQNMLSRPWFLLWRKSVSSSSLGINVSVITNSIVFRETLCSLKRNCGWNCRHIILDIGDQKWSWVKMEKKTAKVTGMEPTASLALQPLEWLHFASLSLLLWLQSVRFETKKNKRKSRLSDWKERYPVLSRFVQEFILICEDNASGTYETETDTKTYERRHYKMPETSVHCKERPSSTTLTTTGPFVVQWRERKSREDVFCDAVVLCSSCPYTVVVKRTVKTK